MPLPRRNAKHRAKSRRERRAFSLIEILIVVALLSILAAAAMPLFTPSMASQLEQAASLLVADLDYARGLSIANNSRYRLVFPSDGSGYYLEHSGANAALNTLPESSLQAPGSLNTRQVTSLATLPGMREVRLAGVYQNLSLIRLRVTDVQFEPLGATTRAAPTEIWLSAGSGKQERFMPVTLDPVTGLASAGEVTGRRPTFLVLP